MALIEELKRHIADGDVVVIAGTGVSIQATNNAPYASWFGLIDDGLDHAVELGRMTARVAASTKSALKRRAKDLDFLLSTTHDLTAKLGPNFEGWLKKRISALHAVNRDVIELLPQLGAIVATTNYDHLITDVTGLPAVPWTNGAAVEDVLRNRKRGVLHLHGSYDVPESVVFDVLSYKRLEDSEHAQAVLTTLRTAKTLLFIGCGDGLRDPHFAAFLRWTEKAFEKSAYSHFILCRKKEVRTFRREHLPERHLEPIAYGEKFSDLPDFLRSLLPGVAAPPPPPALPRAKVIPDPGPCFGRENEVRAVTDALLGHTAARLAILGTGGLGKTTLTLQALQDARIKTRFGERIFFVRCDAATTMDGLLTAIAAEMRVTGTHIRDSLIDALAECPALLVLDNLETPWQFAPLDVEEFLAQLSGIESLHLVVTMRGQERPAGVLWRDPLEPPLLSLPAAREAFLAVAGSKFNADPHLDVLLEAMDRLPVGITLMAYVAQNEVHLNVLLERWQKKRTTMLQRVGGKVKATNIEVSFDLSIDSPRVGPNAKRLLSMLAALPAGVAHQDIGELLEDGEEAAAVLRGCGLAFDDGDRLRMLAPLRSYVSVRYPPTSADTVRLVEHYLKLSQVGEQIGRASGQIAVQRLVGEVANIEWVLQRATEYPSYRLLLRSAAYQYGSLIENSGLGSFEALRSLAEFAKHHADAELRSWTLEALARVALVRADLVLAREYLDEVLLLRREQNDDAGCAWATSLLGDVAWRLSDDAAAETRYREALELFRRTEDVMGQADCLRSLGDVLFRRLDYEAARHYYNEGLALAEGLEEALGTKAACIRMIGRIFLRESDLAAAGRQFEQARPLYEITGDFHGQANCCLSFGELSMRLGNDKEARENFAKAITLFSRVGDRLSVGIANHMMAGLVRGDKPQCLQYIQAARTAYLPIRPDLAKQLDEDFADL